MPTLQFRGRSFIENYHEALPHHTLIPDASLSVELDGAAPPLDGNLIIEGDNLLALQSLLPFYRGRVKCIYIDPPYNTGNEHWVYNDNVSGAIFKEWLGKEVGPQGEDFNRHDKWCCMMWPRLQLLRELLREDGVIFVSIDDNEVQHLRMLMDEIFSEDDFVTTIVWQKNFSPKNTARQFSESHDYVVVYAKKGQDWQPNLVLRTSEQDIRYKNPDDDARGVWTSSDLSARNFYSQGLYSVTCPSGRVIAGPAKGRYWTVSEENFQRLRGENRIWFGADGNSMPRFKRFLTEVKDGVVPQTIWLHTEAGNTQEAKKEIVESLQEDDEVFSTPKPTRLIRRILQLSTSSEEEDIILDSFSGSGTTAQAVLQLNAEDGGNRRFILVQMPYDNKEDEREGKNIARDITRERVKRVIEGVGDKVPALGGSFTYCTLSEEPLRGYYGMLRRDTLWEELAGYIWQAETMSAFDPAQATPATGRIGQVGNMAVYLLYTQNTEDSLSFNANTLKLLEQELAKTIIVYCEKLWVDADVLRLWARDHQKVVQARLLPTQLR